ncbi:DUF1740-domain-containing protein [Artomyces pyxidatus]|uniref:DUF1740-domain-containing protein n=1 Tax=Artomyces pyxidatus TaxID=48021 RepID=A0ACB8THB8_9AGAM|nr:DUF1740-domain-containing protein [Artomyces pyxidatus]
MTAPSFSSFPPSFSSFPDLAQDSTKPSASSSGAPRDSGARGNSRRSEKDSSQHRKRRKDKRVDEHVDHPARHKRTTSSRHTSPPFDDERTKAKEDLELRTGRPSEQSALDRPIFYSDKKGDPLNLRYGGLDTKEVPRYYLVGGGKKILGLSHAWTALRRTGKAVEVAVGGRRKMPSITDSKSRALLNAPPVRRLVASADSARKFQEVEGFIRLPSLRHRQHGDEQYRTIERSKDDADSDYESDSASDTSESTGDEGDAPVLTAYQEKMRDLERQLSADPASIDTWLALLSHSLSQMPLASKNATKARSEITLSILTRALSSLPNNFPSTRLTLLYLQAGEEVWTVEKLKDEWETALKSSDPEIRMAWLEWRIRRAEAGVEGMLEDARRVLSMLTNEIERLRVLWRLATGLRQAGFTERSMALFQAQAEVCFRSPAIDDAVSFEDQLDLMEEFWESEIPRIGEPGATGWATWIAEGRPDPNGIPSISRTRAASKSYDPYMKWAEDEMRADQSLQAALRSTDAEADLDPYATILFTDIRPFLSAIVSVRAKNLLRLIWLSFLGLHIPGFETSLALSPTTENTGDRWSETYLISPPYLTAIYPSSSNARRIAANSQAGVIVGKEQEYAAVFGPVKHWGYRAVAPLEAHEFRNGEKRWGMWTSEDVQGVNIEFVRRVFEQCRSGAEDVEWDVLALAFEAAINVKSALKLSRSFLANARESLPHWAAHARLERIRGRLDDARKVYQTVLTAPTSSQNRLSTGQLWWDWAEMEWLAGHPTSAAEVALRAAGVEGSGGIALLRAKRVFEDTVREIPVVLWKVREAWIRIGALLELTAGSDLPLFLTGPLEAGSVAQESMAVASLSMLFHHIVTLHSPTRPGILRERLEKAVELFPNNTVILGMFLEMQKGQGVWGRVRELVGEAAGDGSVREKSVSRRVVDVWIAGWEQGRWEWEIERTRSGLAAAVDSERTRGSPVLWRIFIEFEIRTGQLQRAKNLMFRAIGQCPLVKELYLVAFDRLRPVFSPRELNSLGETMAERGLRMRRGLDEALEGWEEAREAEVNESSTSGEEDEIEYNAKELKRLKPY